MAAPVTTLPNSAEQKNSAAALLDFTPSCGSIILVNLVLKSYLMPNDDFYSNYELGDWPGTGSDSLSYAELVSALLHRHQHDVAHPDDARHQGSQAHNPDEDMDAFKKEAERVGFQQITVI